MDFKIATDILTRRVTADEIAEVAGVSISSIARARLDESSSAYRSPPTNWELALIEITRERCEELISLRQALETQLATQQTNGERNGG